MKLPKRYSSASQIEAAIDKCYELSRQCLERADEMDTEADELLDHGSKWLESVKLKRDQANKLRVKAQNLIGGKAKKLSAKLAEFQTIPMPFLDDTSVSRRLK